MAMMVQMTAMTVPVRSRQGVGHVARSPKMTKEQKEGAANRFVIVKNVATALSFESWKKRRPRGKVTFPQLFYL